MKITKKEILERREVLKEDTVENILLAAGFIPVIGEVFDIISIIRYIVRKEYLYAGLMLIALIPTVGDFIIKPFIKILKGTSGATKVVLSSADDIVRLAKTNPKLAQEYVKIQQHLGNPKIGQLIKQVESIPGFGSKWARGMEEAINQNKIAIAEIKGLKSLPGTIGKEISAGGKFSTGFKNFFQEKALARYVAKKGMEPSTWVSRWWNVVRQGRKDRRDIIKKFIIANGILDIFGLPSFNAFEEKIEMDPNFRNQLANNPQFSGIVNQSGITSEELSSIESQQGSTEGGGIQKTFMNLAMLKTLAKLYT
jgi:hypothetical protein